MVEALGREPPSHSLLDPLAAGELRGLAGTVRLLTEQIERQTKLSRALAETDAYRERVRILRSIPGVGLIAAMESSWSCKTWRGFAGPISWRLTSG